MPRIYKQNCKLCDKYYEGRGQSYCSRECLGKDEEWVSRGVKTRKQLWESGKRWDISKFIKAGSDTTRGRPKPSQANEKNPAWKGDKVGYGPLHVWVARHYGKPMECANCNTTDYHRYEWANISGTYQRERWDWIRLCVPCHRQQAAGRILIEVI